MTQKSELGILVNRLRSKGYSYPKIKEQLVKMGNSAENVDNAITEYVNEMCG